MSPLFIFDKRSHSAAEHEDDCHKMYPKLDTKRIMIKSFTMSNNMNHKEPHIYSFRDWMNICECLYFYGVRFELVRLNDQWIWLNMPSQYI